MPFQSKAQSAKCYAMKKRNPNSTWDCSEWSEKTDYSKLPAKKAAYQLGQQLAAHQKQALSGRDLAAATGQAAALGGLLGLPAGAAYGTFDDEHPVTGPIRGGLRGAVRGAGIGAGGLLGTVAGAHLLDKLLKSHGGGDRSPLWLGLLPAGAAVGAGLGNMLAGAALPSRGG